MVILIATLPYYGLAGYLDDRITQRKVETAMETARKLPSFTIMCKILH